jgi:hypothetical protein
MKDGQLVRKIFTNASWAGGNFDLKRCNMDWGLLALEVFSRDGDYGLWGLIRIS